MEPSVPVCTTKSKKYLSTKLKKSFWVRSFELDSLILLFPISHIDGKQHFRQRLDYSNWHPAIGIIYLELVEYDTVQLLSHIWNSLKLIPFNWYQTSGTGRLSCLELVKTDTTQLVSHTWNCLKLIPLNWYQTPGTVRRYNSIGITRL